MMWRSNNISTQNIYKTLGEASRFSYYNCGDLSYSATQCSLINIICEKSLMHYDNNKKLY